MRGLEGGELKVKMLMVYTLTVVYMPLEVVDRAVLWSTVSTVDLAHKLIHPSAEKLKLTCGCRSFKRPHFLLYRCYYLPSLESYITFALFQESDMTTLISLLIGS